MSITNDEIITAPLQNDPLPSTFDLPLTDEPQQDAILALLRNARDRYENHHSFSEYYTHAGEVCAVGAVFAATGKPPQYFAATKLPGPRARLQQPQIRFYMKNNEKSIVVAALKLLDKAAKKLYPDAMGEYNDDVRFPGSKLEDVNQGLPEGLVAKQAVLACYDRAINKRKNKLAKETA